MKAVIQPRVMNWTGLIIQNMKFRTYINKTVGHRRYLWTKYNIPIMLCFPPPLRLGPKDIKILIPPEAVS